MRQAVQVIYRQVGWMKCVACSDFKRFPGRMWLGLTRAGDDEVIACPSCNGTGQVARFQVIDASTGHEIDYEAFGRTRADEPEPEGVHHGQRI